MSVLSKSFSNVLARLEQKPLLRLLVAVLLIGVPFILAAKLIQLALPDQGWRGVGNLLRGALLVSLYAGYVRWIERRPVDELALGGALKEFAVGAGLASLLIALFVLLLSALGCYAIVGTNGWVAISSVLPAMLVVAIAEEIVLRALLFRMLEQAFGSWLALGVSSLLFGLMHLGNPNATLFTSLCLALQLGVMFAAAYMLTRRLWLCTGLHFGWNYAQAGVFAIPMSGFEPKALVLAEIQGPNWLTGGAFGAEGAVPGLLLCLLLSGWLLRKARQQCRVVPWPAQPRDSVRSQLSTN